MWRVDVSEAPQDHPDLDATLQDIQSNLSDPKFVRSICIHEAAHAVYWRKLGIMTMPDYKIRVRLVPSPSRCVIEYAAVVPLNPDYLNGKEVRLLDIARAHAAGKVAVEVLCPGYGSGYAGDFDNFNKDVSSAILSQQVDLTREWQIAEGSIKSEIEMPGSVVRKQIEDFAISFERGFRNISELA